MEYFTLVSTKEERRGIRIREDRKEKTLLVIKLTVCWCFPLI